MAGDRVDRNHRSGQTSEMSSPSSSSNPPSRSTKTPLSSNKRKTVPLCNGEGDSGAGSAAYDICHFSQDDIEQQPPKKTGKLVKKTQRVFVGILHKPLQQTEGISYSSAGEAVNQTNGTETGDEQGSRQPLFPYIPTFIPSLNKYQIHFKFKKARSRRQPKPSTSLKKPRNPPNPSLSSTTRSNSTKKSSIWNNKTSR